VKKNHETFQSGYLVSRSKFEPAPPESEALPVTPGCSVCAYTLVLFQL